MILLKTKYNPRRNYTRSYHTPSMGFIQKVRKFTAFSLKNNTKTKKNE